MSARELEEWMRESRDDLDERAVRARFGRGPDMGRRDAATWISFTSAVGSGRLVRQHDGSCRIDARRHADGAVLLDRSEPFTTTVELTTVLDALTNRRGAPARPAGIER